MTGSRCIAALPHTHEIVLFLREGNARDNPLRITVGARDGGRGRIRTDERAKRADLQSASFSHLDTLPAKEDRILD